jgi:hypothetical protein
MLPGEVQGDAAFTAFQAKLATVVVNAPKLGKEVGPCCCPLGAHPEANRTHPASQVAQAEGWPEVPRDHLVEFINGWNGFAGDAPGFRGPYAELGDAYRKMFGMPEGRRV